MFSVQGNRSDSGVTKGTPPNFWGYVYRTAILDTATLLESPLGPPMFWQAAGTNDSVQFGIPNPPAVTTGYKINVYRALVVYTAWDTTWMSLPDPEGIGQRVDFFRTRATGRDCIIMPDGGLRCFLSNQPRYDPGGDKDSIYEDNYFLLTQLDEGDTLYADTLGHDSITFSFDNLYSPSVPPKPNPAAPWSGFVAP